MNDKMKLLLGRMLLSLKGLENLKIEEQVELVELIHKRLVNRIKGHYEAERDKSAVEEAVKDGYL